MNQCNVCDARFSRLDNLKRHKRNLHQTQEEKTERTTMPTSTLAVEVPTDMAFKFQHPCSIVLSGPSGGGKTVLTKKIICENWIQPLPQRIIWCYGQYQPLYEGIKCDLPHIEFVKGIPDFLEHDSYLDPSARNCIILDDLMGDAKKDERVSNLFTRGSHHRNLTVIYLTQNLFPQGKACRDISLNTKFLLLFNNPTDRAQVMTLARRIYPTNTHIFMNAYEQAVARPYGHLLVDLRATTPEQDRLRPNILHYDVIRGAPSYEKSMQDRFQPNILRDDVLKGVPSKIPDQDKFQPPIQCADTNPKQWYPTYDRQSSDSSDTSSADMPICEDCGKMFEDWETLLNHVKRHCTKRDMEPENKRSKKQSIEDMDKELYFPWTKPHVKSEWLDKVKEKEDEMGSRDKAVNSLLPGIQKTARRVMGDFLISILKIQQDVFYQTIMKSADSLAETNNVDMDTAIRQTIRMYKDRIDTILMPPRDESDTEDDESDIEESEVED